MTSSAHLPNGFFKSFFDTNARNSTRRVRAFWNDHHSVSKNCIWNSIPQIIFIHKLSIKLCPSKALLLMLFFKQVKIQQQKFRRQLTKKDRYKPLWTLHQDWDLQCWRSYSTTMKRGSLSRNFRRRRFSACSETAALSAARQRRHHPPKALKVLLTKSRKNVTKNGIERSLPLQIQKKSFFKSACTLGGNIPYCPIVKMVQFWF